MTVLPAILSTMNKTIKHPEEVLQKLADRFAQNMGRHKNCEWAKVATKLKNDPDKLWSLGEMERTGGEPDVVDFDKKNNEYVFADCSAETPEGRRNVCYDQAALEARKKFPPKDSAQHLAHEMGIELLTEAQYNQLQQIGEFDVKTSSWIATPDEVRKLGGAIFADRRYNRVFIYHNGADSYYASRGFRGQLRV